MFGDVPPPKPFGAPPPYERTTTNQSLTIDIDEHNEIHSKLPTYEEVEIEKSLNGELSQPFSSPHPLSQPQLTGIGITRLDQPSLTFLSVETNTDSNPNSSSEENSLLGTDVMFISAFTIAFIFNWIGFLLLTCFCHVRYFTYFKNYVLWID